MCIQLVRTQTIKNTQALKTQQQQQQQKQQQQQQQQQQSKTHYKKIYIIMSNIMKKMWCCGAKGFGSNDFNKSDVPKGHVRVYVGKDEEFLCKFEMEANYLNHPLFENLLRLSEEEFGFSYEGALRIACEIDVFQYLIHLLKTSNPSAHYMELPDLISKVYDAKQKQHWPSR